MRARYSWVLALMLLGPAYAQQHEDMPDNTDAFRKDPFGQSTPYMELDRAREQAPERAISGTLIEREGDRMWIDVHGAVVPFVVVHQRSLTGLVEGDEVRASFRVVEERNIASEVERIR